MTLTLLEVDGGAVMLTRQLLGYFATHHLLGEGALKATADNSRTNSRSEKDEAANESLRQDVSDEHTSNFNFKVWVKVRPKIQNWTFSRMNFEALCWVALVIKTTRIVKIYHLSYMSVRFKQGSVMVCQKWK